MPVRRRLALVFPGFEPLPVEAHCKRFVREAKKTGPVYDMTIDCGEVRYEAGAVGTGVIAATASGDDWRTETEVVVYGLGDLSDVYLAKNPVSRILGGLAALADFVVTGTFFRFIATSWRYGFFFLYPLVLLAAAIAIAAIVGSFVPGPVVVRWVVGLVVLAGLLWLASAKMHFLLMMDDWAFAHDIARERRPDMVRRMEALAADIETRLADADAEEVVFAAHSFGAITAVQCLAALLRRGTAMPETGLMTVGSSLLKAALHPAAKGLREAVATVVSGPVAWLDVQSLTDVINFFRSDPAGSLGISGTRMPKVIAVRFREQLKPATYRAIKLDFFRVHRQFVYAVEKRSAYSFHAILCGPEPFAEIARRGGLAHRKPGKKAEGAQ